MKKTESEYEVHPKRSDVTKFEYEVHPKGSDVGLSVEIDYLPEGTFSIAVLVGGVAEPLAYSGIVTVPMKGKVVPPQLVFKRLSGVSTHE